MGDYDEVQGHDPAVEEAIVTSKGSAESEPVEEPKTSKPAD